MLLASNDRRIRTRTLYVISNYRFSGSPFIANVSGDFPLVNGSALNSAPVGTNSYFTMSNVSGNLEDIEVNVEGKYCRILRYSLTLDLHSRCSFWEGVLVIISYTSRAFQGSRWPSFYFIYRILL